MDKTLRKRIIITVSIIAVVLAVSTVISISSREEAPVDQSATSLTPNTDNPETTGDVEEKKSGIYGLNLLSTTRLTTIQKTHIEVQLVEFIALYDIEKILYLTIQNGSLATAYNDSRSANEIRFDIVSNNGVKYIFSGLYIARNDMYVTVYSTANNPVYVEPYDAIE